MTGRLKMGVNVVAHTRHIFLRSVPRDMSILKGTPSCRNLIGTLLYETYVASRRNWDV